MRRFLDAGVDPYTVVLSAMRRRGREALLSFRIERRIMATTSRGPSSASIIPIASWAQAPSTSARRRRRYRLPPHRGSGDSLRLRRRGAGFQSLPRFFRDGTTDERMAKMNSLVDEFGTW